MTVYVNSENQSRIAEAFVRFNARHPEVLHEVIRMARQLRSRPNFSGTLSIGMICEAIRWRVQLGELDLPPINHNYRALLAREAMEVAPDLAGAFSTRELGKSSHRVP